jgi:3-deoxy-7-phosphoheptulonate synthase
MIAVLKQGTTKQQRDSLCEWFKNMGLEVHVSEGKYKTIIGLIGDTSKVDIELLESLSIIESVKRISEPFKNANRKFHTEDSVVDVGGVKIGGGNFQIIAGPCSVETREQIITVAKA